MAESEDEGFHVWGVVELFGHDVAAGVLTEEELFGDKLLRVDIPDEDGGFVTKYWGGKAIFSLTPTTEEVARLAAKRCRRAPANVYGLPAPRVNVEPDYDDEDEEE